MRSYIKVPAPIKLEEKCINDSIHYSARITKHFHIYHFTYDNLTI